MNFHRLGNSSLKLSTLTFGSALTIGTENTEPDFAAALVEAAWEGGVRSFDTSDNYGEGRAEELLGAALRRYPRQQYVIATKGSWPVGDSPYERGLSRKHLVWALECSLRRLKLDYVDLYYAHRYDPEVPMDEVIRTFNDFIRRGLILHWAVSEWPTDALRECLKRCAALGLEAPVADQFIYSYAVRKHEDDGTLELCKEHGLGCLCFSPLCQGYLTGKYRDGVPSGSRIAKADLLSYHKTAAFYEQNKERIDRFLTICESHGVSCTAAALQWCLRRGILPVCGASTPAQLRDNLMALQEPLPDALWAQLEAEHD